MNDIVSPKPVKQYFNHTFSVRKNYYNKLRIDQLKNQDIPHPKSTSNIKKTTSEQDNMVKEQENKSSNFPLQKWISEEQMKDEGFNFFEDISHKEGQDQIYNFERF